jgi:predicted GIY-YIG superfamily endonuclease
MNTSIKQSTTFIYALIDPKEKNESHIYIGKSDNPYKRYYEHLQDKYPCHKTNWIQSLLKLGLIPNLQILEQCENTKIIWSEKERENISFYKKCGYDVVNTSEGG